MREGVKELKRKMGNGTTASVETKFGKLTAASPEAMLAGTERPEPVLEEGGNGLAPSRGLLESLPPGATVAMLATGTKGRRLAQDFSNVGGQTLAAPVMGVAIFDDKSQNIKQLKEPLLFKLPDPSPGAASDPKAECAYLEVGGGALKWSNAGVRRASDAEVLAIGANPAGVWCVTEHLSIFAALAQAVLGCTNLELLTPAGMSAILEHEGWWRARPSLLFLGVAGALLFLLLLAGIREACALRLGRNYVPGKSVKICNACIKWGPQVLKHKYAAFVVFGRDMMQCMAKGRDKLRLPTLISGVQRSLAVRTGISTACVAQHCWNGGAWLETSASLPHTVLCRKLEFHSGGAEEVIENELQGRWVWHKVQRLLVTFLALHPLLDALRLGAGSMGARKRGTLQVASFIGVLATNGMIFNFSGAQRDWEADAECPIEPTSNFFIIIATFVSVLLNVLPNSFLADMGKQVHGRPGWIVAWWAATLCYLLWAGFVVIIALANLNPKDQGKWFKSMQWSLTIKFLGMPAVQALRNWLMLEAFLHEGSKSKHIESSMGLQHKQEPTLPPNVNAKAAVSEMAKRGISAEELLNFTAMLGEKVMPEYSPETSTSRDVFVNAVRHFCQDGAASPEGGACLSVSVAEVTGLRPPAGPGNNEACRLHCVISHLGVQEQLSRPKLAQQRGDSLPTTADGALLSCKWDFQASVPGVEFDHALSFSVLEGERTVGVAWLSLQDILQGHGFDGALHLHFPEEESAMMCAASCMTPPTRRLSLDSSVAASKGAARAKVELSQQARLKLKVELKSDFLQHFAKNELRKMRASQPVHQSEADDTDELLSHLLRLGTKAKITAGSDRAWEFAPSGSSYCDPFKHGSLPPEKLVAHSLDGNFFHLVASLLADAVGEKDAFERVSAKLSEKDYHGVLDMLRQHGQHRRRYWIDMFAMDLDPNFLWHKDMLASLPTLLRSLKRACCSQMVADIEARRDPSCSLPVQLIVLDRKFTLLEQSNCIAEVQLASAMSLPQRLLLHPEHLVGPALGDRFRGVVTARFPDAKLKPWTRPYTEDKTTACKILSSLAVKSVKDHNADRGESVSMDDLHLSDVVAVAAFAASRSGVAYQRGASTLLDDLGDVEV